MIDKLATFEKLCRFCKIDIPNIEIVDGEKENVTGPGYVKLNKNDEVQHVFGHYLADLHNDQADVVADVISGLVQDAQSYRCLLEAREENGNAF